MLKQKNTKLTSIIKGQLKTQISVARLFSRKKSALSKNGLEQATLNPATSLSILLAVTVFSFASFIVPMVRADRFEEQIGQLRAQNNESQVKVSALATEARNLEDAIEKMQAEINALQAKIAANQAESAKLQEQIIIAEAELARQKDILGQNIKAMYLEGQISTIEMLATSKDLSQFVDKQQYREVVRAKIKTQVDKITQLRLELNAKKDAVEKMIKEDTQLRAQVAANKAEQNRLLGLNQAERANFNNQIKENNKKIADLRREQALENIRRFGGSGGVIGGGGYPWGNARCLQTGQVDGWCPTYEWGYNGSYHNWSTGGYAFRNCTDWVAWRTGAPGGLGHAKTWASRAPSYGYRVQHSISPGEWRPRIAAVSTSGFYGHVMYVEAVNDNGTIVVSDYNRAGTGKYDMNQISASGLSFVFF